MEKKRSWLWISTGLCAGIGGLLATWLAPKVIAWYFEPPAQFGLSCKNAIEWSLSRFQWAQFCGVIVGAVLPAIFYLAVIRPRKALKELKP